VIGTSVGAINAGYFAGAPNAQGVAKLAEIWSGLRRSDVFSFTFASAFGMLRHPDHIVDSGRLRRLIENNLPYARLEDAAIPVHVTATNVQGMAVLLSKGPAIDAILASAAIPAIFPPVRIDGEVLMDGAIANNTPIRAAADLGASRIVVLPTGYACALKEPPNGAIARALHAITLLIEWQLIREFERLGDEVHICIVPTLCPLAVSPYDFSASRRLMQRAAANTRRWLSGGGLAARSLPQELQAHRH
jgi:NTE family protein